MTVAPFVRAISVVPSVLPESTTTISSAHRTLSMAAPMCSASFSVMMVTDSLGTGGFLPERRFLHGLEVHNRAMRVEDGAENPVKRVRSGR